MSHTPGTDTSRLRAGGLLLASRVSPAASRHRSGARATGRSRAVGRPEFEHEASLAAWPLHLRPIRARAMGVRMNSGRTETRLLAPTPGGRCRTHPRCEQPRGGGSSRKPTHYPKFEVGFEARSWLAAR